MKNRPKAPGLFALELAAAVARLEDFPHKGKTYSCQVQGMHRMLLPRRRYHVYYTYDDDRCRVRVHAIWHASRERGPSFSP